MILAYLDNLLHFELGTKVLLEQQLWGIGTYLIKYKYVKINAFVFSTKLSFRIKKKDKVNTMFSGDNLSLRSIRMTPTGKVFSWISTWYKMSYTRLPCLSSVLSSGTKKKAIQFLPYSCRERDILHPV